MIINIFRDSLQIKKSFHIDTNQLVSVAKKLTVIDEKGCWLASQKTFPALFFQYRMWMNGFPKRKQSKSYRHLAESTVDFPFIFHRLYFLNDTNF